jgi:ribosome-associated protein
MDEGSLAINKQLIIPRSELSFRFSRSGGPGGQHAQKTSTRVELRFDVANSPSLTDAQRSQVLKRLSGYVDSAGVLHLVSQSERSQARNREEVVSRFEALLRKALKRRKRRKPTRPPAAAEEDRLQEKRHRSQLKKSRGKVQEDD